MHKRQHDGQHQKHKVEVGTDVIPHGPGMPGPYRAAELF